MNKELLKLIQPELTENEVRELCKEKKEELGFDIEKAMFPTNPLLIEKPLISIESAVELVEKWSKIMSNVRSNVGYSVTDSVGYSVWSNVGYNVGYSVTDSVWVIVRSNVGYSVWSSVGASVGASVGDSVGASVGASVWAYVSSIFYKIDDWQYIEHESGVNPFQPAIDLWEAGYIASFDGGMWRLHAGKDAKIVWEGNFK